MANKQLKLDFKSVHEPPLPLGNKEDLDREYDEIIVRGPQDDHSRPKIKKMHPFDQRERMKRLKEIIEILRSQDVNDASTIMNTHKEHLKLINEIKQRVKTNDTLKKVFDKYGISLDEIDLVPVCFADLDVSARTDHGCIYLGLHLLDEPETIDHYLVHELTHYAQQTTGDGPTKGSTDDSYLDNKFEQEGFQAQTEYISETRDDDAAEKYVNQVLDHHGEKGKERKDKRKKLLRLNAFNMFFKQAGLLKVPEKLLYDVISWADAALASKVRIRIKEQLDRYKNLDQQKKYVDEINGFVNDIGRDMEGSIYNTIQDYGRNYSYSLKTPDSGYFPREFQFDLKMSMKLKDNYAALRPNKKRYDEYDNDEYDYWFNIDYIGPTVGSNINSILGYDEAEMVYEKIMNATVRPLRKYCNEQNNEIWELENTESIVELNLLLKETEKFSHESHSNSFNTKEAKVFALSSYFDNQELQYDKVKILLWFDSDEADKAYQNPEKTGWGGLYFSPRFDLVHEIWTKANAKIDNLQEFKYAINSLNDTLRHELQHLIQEKIKYVANMSNIGGLPSKKIRDPRVSPDGTPLDIVNNPKNEKLRIEHSLRDIEFYTRLSDEVDEFNNRWKNAPNKIKLDAFKIAVGLKQKEIIYRPEHDYTINNRDARAIDFSRRETEYYKKIRSYEAEMNPSGFFIALKENAPEKWKKAVKEFFKAVI